MQKVGSVDLTERCDYIFDLVSPLLVTLWFLVRVFLFGVLLWDVQGFGRDHSSTGLDQFDVDIVVPVDFSWELLCLIFGWVGVGNNCVIRGYLAFWI